MANSVESRKLIAIPSVPVLTIRLASILAEAKRLKLLIRTAKELEKIHSETQFLVSESP